MRLHGRTFTIKEYLRAMYYAANSFPFLQYVRRNKLFNKQWKERLMLKITEVNGCTMCSYVHTKIALNSGMTNQEIQSILDGDTLQVPKEQIVSILFSMHYADTHENPDKEAIERVVNEYGNDIYHTIVAICRFITFTNAFGITISRLKARLSFQKIEGGCVLVEIPLLLLTVLIFPILLAVQFIYFPFSSDKFQLKNKSN